MEIRRGSGEGLHAKGHKETVQSVGYVHYLDRGSVSQVGYICQSLPNFTLNICCLFVSVYLSKSVF